MMSNLLDTQLKELMTGDILLFSNKGSCWLSPLSFFSKLIDCCSQSKYSHAGIVLKDPTYIDPSFKGVYMLESGDRHNGIQGVQLTPLSEVLDNWPNYDIYVRHLVCIRDDSFYTKLAEVHKQVHGLPYDTKVLDWMTALERAKGNPLWLLNANKRNQSTDIYWCSALVSYVYTRLGFLLNSTPWTLVAPKDLGTETPNENKLKFYNCTVMPEVKLHRV